MLVNPVLKNIEIKKQHENNKSVNTKLLPHDPVFIDKYHSFNIITRLINNNFLLKGEIND